MKVAGVADDGFRIALYGVSLGRIYNSARAVGQGRWALEQAIDYAKQRRAFGAPPCLSRGGSRLTPRSCIALRSSYVASRAWPLLRRATPPAQRKPSQKLGERVRPATRSEGMS